MKVKVYLRIAPTSRGFRVAATSKPSDEPLRASSYRQDSLPTITFAVVFDIPREAWEVPTIGEVPVPLDALHLLPDAEVQAP